VSNLGANINPFQHIPYTIISLLSAIATILVTLIRYSFLNLTGKIAKQHAEQLHAQN